ncbi:MULTISPECIES: hypothetical protein [unclassified Streptomyces]|uniref:hypothetical protein n=1 Tax=unclassified Streptomyces TaxID=2593676 RepID=UPI000DAC3978|nr:MULTISPECIES: hypothetical protein [unclassified Streptomyces]PZT75721.1 hypothetical protein DNK56_19995 [Streptomyces sp. AC1-42W]PZT80326.1 hypothetical protein DNK55_12690 [Streptomyces sp. AC1-42T]
MTHGEPTGPAAFAPERGSFAVDGRDGRVGRVMGHVGPSVQLRPPGGGTEWDCPLELLKVAQPADVLRARLSEVNWEGQLPR